MTAWEATKRLAAISKTFLYRALWGGGTGGRETGRKGAGGVREAGEDGAGSGRNREKLCNIAQYFAIEKMQRGRSRKIQGENRD